MSFLVYDLNRSRRIYRLQQLVRNLQKCRQEISVLSVPTSARFTWSSDQSSQERRGRSPSEGLSLRARARRGTRGAVFARPWHARTPDIGVGNQTVAVPHHTFFFSSFLLPPLSPSLPPKLPWTTFLTVLSVSISEPPTRQSFFGRFSLFSHLSQMCWRLAKRPSRDHRQ